MKRTTLATFVLALTAVTFAQSPVFAQTNKDQKMTARIDFAFTVSGHNLPAGEYQVQEIDSSHAVSLRNMATGDKVFILAASTDSNNDGRTSLLFDHYGDQYFLAQVNGRFHNALSLSRRERELAAHVNEAVEPILVALR